MGPPPAAAGSASGDEGLLGQVRTNTWASIGVLLVLWLVLGFLAFLIFAFVSQSFTLALVAGPIGGLAAAAAVGWQLGLLQPVDEARQTAPLWVRLLLPLPLFIFAFLLGFVVLGAFLTDFVLITLASLVLATAGTVAAVLVLDLWRDVPTKVRGTPPMGRLLVLAGVGLIVGLGTFLIGLLVFGEVEVGLALFLPAAIAGAVLTGFLSGWSQDARDTARAQHVGTRIGVFVLLLIFTTVYFSLLVGPLLTELVAGYQIPDAIAGYTVSFLLALILLVPLSMWVHTWRDLWDAFTAMGEDHRILAVLPIFPLSAALIFLVIVALTSLFEVAYVVSIPAGLALFLLAGLPFGVTQDIPKVVRDQDLPARTGIFVATFLLITLYAYFGVGFFLDVVEISLLIALAFAGLVMGLLIWTLDLTEGLGKEFESYGAPAEAAVLALISVATFLISFLLIALALDDFRAAFLLSVVAAAAANYLIAHSTGMIHGMRAALGEMPWWGDLAALAAVFVVVFAYGAIALGLFYNNVAVAYTFGALLATASVFALAKDLEVGDDMLTTADDRRNARVVLMTLTFLGGLLVGLYATAALMSLAGSSLFGLPLFVGLITGSLALVWISKRRGWGTSALGRVQSRSDRVKVASVLVAWLAIGTLTGFALQSIPVGSQDLGLGDDPVLPLTLTLAAGLLLWSWLPALLFRILRVERTPVRGTSSLPEKHKFWASVGWGLVTVFVVAAILLSVIDNPVIGMAAAILAGYLVALAITVLRKGGSGDQEPDDSPIIDKASRTDR